MKVTNNSASQAQAAQVKKNKTDATKGAKDLLAAGAPTLTKADTASAAKVDVSAKAQEMKKAKEIATNTPDVDEAKVAKFQALVDSGKYKVDAEKVADKVVDEYLKDSFAE